MKELSVKQKYVLKVIQDYIDKNGISPTVRELADIMYIKSTSTMQAYIKRLEQEGYITKHPTMPRTIRVIKDIQL
jgi:SOS-response transcriptional repressor LexA